MLRNQNIIHFLSPPSSLLLLLGACRRCNRKIINIRSTLKLRPSTISLSYGCLDGVSLGTRIQLFSCYTIIWHLVRLKARLKPPNNPHNPEIWNSCSRAWWQDNNTLSIKTRLSTESWVCGYGRVLSCHLARESESLSCGSRRVHCFFDRKDQRN